MATHNQVRVVGYLLADPVVRGGEGAYNVIFRIRTTHRNTDDFYDQRLFEDILVFYDDNSPSGFMDRVRKLIQYDLVDIKGVFNVMTLNKASECPSCGMTNVKRKASGTFVYPISLMKRGNLTDDKDRRNELPDEILRKHFAEISNQVLLVGTVVKKPELLGTDERPCCRYPLGVDRKYYIRTQGSITSDYPWVYSFSDQARLDSEHLKVGSLILVDAFIRNREVKNNMICECCGEEYQFPDVATEFIPYSIEYLNGFYSDLEIETMKKEEALSDARDMRRQLGL